MMKKFEVQIKLTVVISKSIKAESMEAALKIAEQLAQKESGVKADKGWIYQWCEAAEVNGVFQ